MLRLGLVLNHISELNGLIPHGIGMRLSSSRQSSTALMLCLKCISNPFSVGVKRMCAERHTSLFSVCQVRGDGELCVLRVIREFIAQSGLGREFLRIE